MVESSVKRIGGSFYVRVPAEEAKRLGLRENTRVDLDVRPLGRSVEDALKHLGRFPKLARDDDLWGSD
jgi:antitoxin component of MazEF toxin-antitoxin module